MESKRVFFVAHLRVYLALPKLANWAFVRPLSDPKCIYPFANQAGFFTKMVLRASVGETGGNSSSTTMDVPLLLYASTSPPQTKSRFTLWLPRCQRASQSSSFESAEIGLFLPMPRKKTRLTIQGVTPINGKSFYNHVYRGCLLTSIVLQSSCLKLLLLVPLLLHQQLFM